MLNKTYNHTKTMMRKLLNNNLVLNIVINENNNQTKKKFLNMCLLTQNHQSFYVILELAKFMQLNACNEAN